MNEKPDECELQVKQWLESQGYSDIQYISETHKQPPDFVVEGRIAVEVRRLTDANATKGKGRGIDKPLEDIISKILEEAGEPPEGHHVYVSCSFYGKDLPQQRVTEKQVKQAVNEYIDNSGGDILQSGKNLIARKVQLECGISTRFYPTPTSEDGKFELMQVTAKKARRVSESIDDINRCIQEKNVKVKKKGFCRYPEWWLVLVDCDFLTPLKGDQYEWTRIRNGLVDTEHWSKIVVLETTKAAVLL